MFKKLRIQNFKAWEDTGEIRMAPLRLIIREYSNKTLREKRQPEAGDEFLLWVMQHEWNPARCTRITVTPKQDDDQDFEEFPEDAELGSFDRSDRIIVSVANSHNPKSSILQACDSDYWNAREALARCGIHVEFLCPDDMKRIIDGRQS